MQALIWLGQFGERALSWQSDSHSRGDQNHPRIPMNLRFVGSSRSQAIWKYIVLFDKHLHQPRACYETSLKHIVIWFGHPMGQACRDAHAWPALGFLSDEAQRNCRSILSHLHMLYLRIKVHAGVIMCVYFFAFEFLPLKIHIGLPRYGTVGEGCSQNGSQKLRFHTVA